MARWRRDPRLRQRFALLLVGGEVLSVTGVFFYIALGYVHYLNGLVRLLSNRGEAYVVIALAGIVLAAAAATGYFYICGRRWARVLFLAANAALLVLGLAWFLKNRLAGQVPQPYAAVGLGLALGTVFPLMWPLLLFEPVPRPPSGQVGA